VGKRSLPEVISNTSPLQYLHQLGILHIFPTLATRVIIPPAVVEELRVGRELGISLPDAMLSLTTFWPDAWLRVWVSG
jgi:predicted nucleic acid-binding protein